MIELEKARTFETGEDTRSSPYKKPLDFSFALRLVWPCVDERNPQACRHVLQVMGTEGCAVVGVELPGQPRVKSASSSAFTYEAWDSERSEILREGPDGNDRR